MKCPQCKLVEMLVKEVNEYKVKFQCKKCGYEFNSEYKEDENSKKVKIKGY